MIFSLVVMVLASVCSGFEPALYVVVNGEAWEGGNVYSGDVVTVQFLDAGSSEIGDFDQFLLTVCDANWSATYRTTCARRSHRCMATWKHCC